MYVCLISCFFFFFKQKTAYELRISDWSSDVCSSDLAMSDNPKTPLDHVNDTLSQLKEMRHYSGNNVEALTAAWLLFDGELSKLEQTAKIDDLMTRQGE